MMITRIEKIEDLVLWLNSLSTLHSKNVEVEELTEEQISGLKVTSEILCEIQPRFPGPFKQCVKCQAIYPETDDWFDFCGQGRTGLHAYCKFCRNAYQKKRNKQKRVEKNLYGFSCQADLDEMNRIRVSDGELPLGESTQEKRGPGRPKKEHTENQKHTGNSSNKEMQSVYGKDIR